jgi:hypothetical protein
MNGFKEFKRFQGFQRSEGSKEFIGSNAVNP